jgi:hypothetical protein
MLMHMKKAEVASLREFGVGKAQTGVIIIIRLMETVGWEASGMHP